MDGDGVKVSVDRSRRRRTLLAGLLCGVAVAVLVALLLSAGEDTVDERIAMEDVAELEVVDVPPPVERAVVKVRRREPGADAPTPVEPGTQDQPEIRASDVIRALRDAGETGGIAAFPPPGTEPLKRGIVVPEDYELPEGYARHYQTTDDGKRVPAILMFAPGYEFLGPDGTPLALPSDRIVPPEMAPPGLPLRMLKLGKRRTNY